jgi:hypothetical protein
MLTKYEIQEEGTNMGYTSSWGYIIGTPFNCSLNNYEFVFNNNEVINIFEEYSKQLRKEENKFDELMEKLK